MSVRAMHKRLTRQRGRASEHRCFFHAEHDLEVPARDWAQIRETGGKDIADYIALCRTCHIRYDSDARLNPESQARWRASAGPAIAAAFTPERRAAYSARLRAWHAERRATGLLALVLALLLSLTALIARPASAATTPVGPRMLAWAETYAAGHWYAWGGSGLSTYDCSGVVYRAALEEGLALPRTTYGMLGSWHLVRTWRPQAGDLAFFGSGHVEFFAHGYDMTFGALQSGTRVGFHHWYAGSWWRPSAFYHLVR